MRKGTVFLLVCSLLSLAGVAAPRVYLAAQWARNTAHQLLADVYAHYFPYPEEFLVVEAKWLGWGGECGLVISGEGELTVDWRSLWQWAGELLAAQAPELGLDPEECQAALDRLLVLARDVGFLSYVSLVYIYRTYILREAAGSLPQSQWQSRVRRFAYILLYLAQVEDLRLLAAVVEEDGRAEQLIGERNRRRQQATLVYLEGGSRVVKREFATLVDIVLVFYFQEGSILARRYELLRWLEAAGERLSGAQEVDRARIFWARRLALLLVSDARTRRPQDIAQLGSFLDFITGRLTPPEDVTLLVMWKEGDTVKYYRLEVG
jgi:hypothetical protein